ncbi:MULTISPECIES: AlbA family DNA-binding domain-containing protein [unclassified Deinococcus]|uniref:AlbA family DNA-binding domain-containing protein n=1 Tax=unclassified Deinococcus TaxID=2623546 RepID=UPI001C303AF6|nr:MULTISPECIES: ATP-binding protein [unclassified Deinococcus]MDK2014045.1 ATP-binding protein [Deinococcus sp. 43]
MHEQDVQHLLQFGESDWLDYKAELGPGIEVPQTSKDQRDIDQGKLLKDLMCLANSPSPELRRYLIRGVKDLEGQRHVQGVSRSLDDADIQSWLHGKFDPPLNVQYWQWRLQDDRYVGVFEITVTPGVAHVPATSHGKALIKGQVWWRIGTQNQLPGAAGLQRLFGPPRPFPRVGWMHGNRLYEHTDFRSWVQQLLQDAQDERQKRIHQAAAALRDVAARPRQSAEAPTNIRVLNTVSPAVPTSIDDKRIQPFLRELSEWGVQLDPGLMHPPDLWGTRPTIWPNWADPLSSLSRGLEGPGYDWYDALSDLVKLVESFHSETNQIRKRGQQPHLTLEVHNFGSALLSGGLLRLTVLEGGQFKFNPLARMSFAPRPGEIRPGPGETAEVVLGDLKPGGRLTVTIKNVHRQLERQTVIRAELNARNLPQASITNLFIT